jgi:hypothetical protein
MSKSVCFNIGNGFVREGDFYVPIFETRRTIRIKPHNGKMAIYVVDVDMWRAHGTCVLEGETFDLLASQFGTIEDIVRWVDRNYCDIPKYDYSSVICIARHARVFTYNGVEHVASVGTGCCKECYNNNILLCIGDMLGLNIDRRNIEIEDGFPQHGKESGRTISTWYNRYLVSSTKGSISICGPDYIAYPVPHDVARLLLGFSLEKVAEIVMEVGCFRKASPSTAHTSYECQCDNCYSERMVVRVEEVLARMT